MPVSRRHVIARRQVAVGGSDDGEDGHADEQVVLVRGVERVELAAVQRAEDHQHHHGQQHGEERCLRHSPEGPLVVAVGPCDPGQRGHAVTSR